MTARAIEVVDIGLRFGGLRAIDDVTLSIDAGRVTGLIGPNGAGKTTLFNVITGLQAPDTGRVLLGGRDVTRLPAYRRARLGVARTFQRLEVFDSLSVRENVQVAAEAAKRRRASSLSVDAIIETVGLSHVMDARVGELPTGLARLVELARSLATSPTALLCDECSSGLTDDETDLVADAVKRVATDGVAVLLVEHDMKFVMSTCDTIHVLDLGRRIASGSPAEIQANPQVQAAYLGTSETKTARRPASVAPPTAAPAVELVGVSAGYGGIDVVRDISFSVQPGEVLALLGPNGAGKTTTLNLINGNLSPTGGVLKLGGRSIAGLSVDALARAGVCTIPEGRGVFPNLSVDDNLRMATYSGVSLDEVRERAFATFPRLRERRKQLAGTMSGGEQQMLALARALVGNPAILIIDELSMGLAPLIVKGLYEQVGELAAASTMTTIIVEQFAHDLLGVASRAAVMMHGRLVETGDPADIADRLTDLYMATDVDRLTTGAR